MPFYMVIAIRMVPSIAELEKVDCHQGASPLSTNILIRAIREKIITNNVYIQKYITKVSIDIFIYPIMAIIKEKGILTK